MKIYAIRDNTIDRNKDLGYFFYCEGAGECCIEINENVDEWELPFILEHFARDKQLTVDEYHTKLFISQRIIPSDRQNIGMILKNNGLDEYDEIKLFILADGRCCQDECYIKPISREEVSAGVKKRMNHRLISFMLTQSDMIMMSFANGEIGMVNIEKVRKNYGWMREYMERLSLAEPSSCGASLKITERVHVVSEKLYEESEILPVNLNEVSSFLSGNFLTTAQVCDELNCTRQNVNDLAKRGKLNPVNWGGDALLFDRREVISRK